ncbi:cytochrome P450 [Luedemannella helvata]|uniref:Cytochrome P450 n=1 Tax=Luedemannella helvata TaxID=349315 RepID=A0ABN2JUD3_9ACTN
MKPFALTGPDQIADPYPVYARYRAVEPVHETAAGWYVFRFDDVAAVLMSPRVGRGAPPGQRPAPLIPEEYPALRAIVENWLVFLDPPRHTRLRALVTRHFTARLVADLRPRIAELAGGLLAEVRAAPVTDLVADFAAPLPILVISELLGVPPGRRDWLRARAVALQEANTSRGGDRAARLGAAEAASVELWDFFAAEVARRRDGGPADLTTALVRAAPALTDTEIISTCVHLLTAGHETTTNLIAKATLALLRHPEVRDRLAAEPALMPGAVEEFVRYDAPVQMVSRRTYEDLRINDVTIPAGGKVTLVLGSANRDPRRFPDPDILDVGRDASRNASFGMGIHYCLGARLAYLEAEIGLTALLRGLPGLAFADEPVEYADDLVFHGPSRLPLATARA